MTEEPNVFVLQVYVEAPAAVRVLLFPAQIFVEEEILSAGVMIRLLLV